MTLSIVSAHAKHGGRVVCSSDRAKTDIAAKIIGNPSECKHSGYVQERLRSKCKSLKICDIERGSQCKNLRISTDLEKQGCNLCSISKQFCC